MPDAGADLCDRGQIRDLLQYLLIRHCSVTKLPLLVESPRPYRAISLQGHAEPRARSDLRGGFPYAETRTGVRIGTECSSRFYLELHGFPLAS